MRALIVVVFHLIAIFSCNDAQLFGGLGAQLQAAQMQQAQLLQAQRQQAQLQQAQLQQAQLQQAQLQQAQLQQAAMLQQQQGLDDEDDDTRRGKGKGFGGFGFGRFRPSFGFNSFFPGFGGFGGFGMPGLGGFGGMPGLGGMGGLGGFNMGLGGLGMNPFGMFGRSTTQTQSGVSGSSAAQQTNQQLQQFMDQMNARFNQREQDFDRMKDDFLIELGQNLKDQYGNQVTEAEVQLYLKNVDEQLRTMYASPEANSNVPRNQSDGNPQQQGSASVGLRNPFRQAQEPRNSNSRSASASSQRIQPNEQQASQRRGSSSSN